LVSIVVGIDGKLHDLRVTSARKPEFDEAALESVSQWRFNPATCDGEPMETEALVEVNFVIQ
jgi:TonB family protein